MARRPRLFAAGLLYHVIVRGNQRQKTFTAESDYQAYIETRIPGSGLVMTHQLG
jgi:REP element-mobilizing transposase RayT